MHVIQHPEREARSPADGLDPQPQPQPQAQRGDGGPAAWASALPTPWYVFFGIVEPISVAAGCIYAVFFQEKYHAELIPVNYLLQSISNTTPAAGRGWRGGAEGGTRGTSAAARAAALTAFAKADTLGPPTRMALSQLGSCYFLIMLNSALMFFALRRFLPHAPATQERILYYLFFVLGAADWTHILLTIHFLPPASATGSGGPLYAFAAKVWVLLRYPTSWNALLFGNIAITLGLFCARAAWWAGLGRDSFDAHGAPAPKVAGRSSAASSKPLPVPPKKSQ